MALGLLGRFTVRGPLIDCFRRGGHRQKRRVYAHLLTNRGKILIDSTNVPTVSSPNRSLITLYCRGNVSIKIIPNPATIAATLTLTKLPAKHFTFRNFLDIGGHDHQRRLSDLQKRAHALIFCRTPRGLPTALRSLLSALKSHHITLIQRLAGIRRRIMHAALSNTVTLCTTRPPHNRFIMIMRNTDPTRIRAFAPTRTLTLTGSCMTRKLSTSRTTGGTTTSDKLGGKSVCHLLLTRGSRKSMKGRWSYQASALDSHHPTNFTNPTPRRTPK